MISHLSARWSGLSKRERNVVLTTILWGAFFGGYFLFGLFTIGFDAEHRTGGGIVLAAAVVGLAGTLFDGYARVQEANA